jgi:hypothetical protein
MPSAAVRTRFGRPGPKIGLLTWRSSASYTRCYRAAWRAVHAGGKKNGGQIPYEEKGKLAEGGGGMFTEQMLTETQVRVSKAVV